MHNSYNSKSKNHNLHLNVGHQSHNSKMAPFTDSPSMERGSNKHYGSNTTISSNIGNHENSPGFSPISPNANSHERQILGSPSIHFSPTHNNFNKSFSLTMANSTVLPTNGSTVGGSACQRPQYYQTLQQPRNLHHQSSNTQLHSPVQIKSPESANFEPIKCEWNSRSIKNDHNSHAGSSAATTCDRSSGKRLAEDYATLNNGGSHKFGPVHSNSDKNQDVQMKKEDDDTEMVNDSEAERRLLPTISNYGTSRIAPVLYSNPGIKYPRYSKVENNKPSTFSPPKKNSSTSSTASDSSSIRLPSIDSMSFSNSFPSTATNANTSISSVASPDLSVLKDRHQSILSSNSSCFSTGHQNSNKRSSYLTTSSLQTSIDRLSINQKEGLIPAIPEYAGNDHVDYSQKQPLRFDRPLPMLPVYQNPSSNNSHHLSDIMSETSAASIHSTNNHSISTNNSLYNQSFGQTKMMPSPSFYNDGSNASFILQQSPHSQPYQPVPVPQNNLHFHSAPLPPLPSPQQQLQHQQQLERQQQQQQQMVHSAPHPGPASMIPPQQQGQPIDAQVRNPSSLSQQLNANGSITSFMSKGSKESRSSKTSGKSAIPAGSGSSGTPLISASTTTSNPSNNSNSLSSSIANYTSTIKFNSAPEEERKYQCKTCGRKFKTSGHVSRHSRIHTGERKHVCPFPGCGTRFARHDNCMQHYKTHSNLNGKTAERMRNLKLKEQLSTKKMKIKALIW